MKRVQRHLMVGLLLAMSCAEPGDDASQTASRATLPERLGPFDALARRFGRLRERMRNRGYAHRLGPTRVMVLEGEGVAFPVDLTVNECTTFVALAGGDMRELLVTLFDGEGREVAKDEVPGEAGLVHVCPQPIGDGQPAAPHHLALRAMEGTGAAIVAGFVPDTLQPEGFDALFGGVVAPRVPMREVKRKLARSRATLKDRGWLPAGTPMLERLAEGEGFTEMVSLESGKCYAAVARGDTGLEDVDLFLFDPAGAEVARELSSNTDVNLEHCPATDGRYTLEVRAFEGAGALGVMLLSAAPSVAQGPQASRSEASEPPREGTSESDENRGQDSAGMLAEFAAELTKRGYGAPRQVVRDALITPGDVRRHDVLLEPGCAIIAGAPSGEDVDLDLYLSDADAHPLDRDSGVQPTARVMACREEASVLQVAVKGYGHEGRYAVAVFAAPPAIHDVQSLRLEQATAPFVARGYVSRPSRRSRMSEGERVTRRLKIAAGQCLAVAVAGDGGVQDLDLFLRAEDGTLLASQTRPASYAAVSRCAEQAEDLRLEIAMYRGSGEMVSTILTGAP